MAEIIGTIQIRRGTTAEWTTADPVLASGEWGLDTDLAQVKIGDGTTTWSALPFFLKGDKGDPGTPGLSYSTLEYDFDQATFAPPGTGDIRFNNSLYDLTTALYVHKLSQLGKDNSNAFTLVDAGNRFFIQDKDEAEKWVSFNATGAGIKHPASDYWEFPVTFRDRGLASLNQNKRVLVNIA